MRRVMNVIRPEVSVAETASGNRRSVKRARSALRLRSRSQSAMKEPKSIWRSLASTGAASRKCTSMNSPSLSAMRCWLLWMIAVCGIGNPSGLRNSATTAYQSARPPMVAASAKAATKPKTGCSGSNNFAVTNSASVPASTSVASSLDAPQLGGARGVAGSVERKGAVTWSWRLSDERIRSLALRTSPSSRASAASIARPKLGPYARLHRFETSQERSRRRSDALRCIRECRQLRSKRRPASSGPSN